MKKGYWDLILPIPLDLETVKYLGMYVVGTSRSARYNVSSNYHKPRLSTTYNLPYYLTLIT